MLKINELKWYVGIPLSISTSMMLLIAFPPYNLNILGFIALIPIYFIAYTQNLKRTFLYGLLSSFLFYCLYLFWMNAYLAIVGVSFVTVVYGGYFLISLLITNIVSKAFPKYRAFLTPFIYLSIEYIKSFRFLGFTFGSIGYTQHNFPIFIQIADIGGEPLVAFIIVLFNASLAHIIAQAVMGEIPGKLPTIMINRVRTGKIKYQVSESPKWRRFLNFKTIPLITAVLLMCFSFIYGNFQLNRPIPETPKLKLALIQGLSSPRTKWKDEKWKTLERLMKLTHEAYSEDPDIDLFVWTETAIRTSLRPNFIYGTPYHMRIKYLVKNLKTYFVIGSPDNYLASNRENPNPESLEAIYPTKESEEIWTNSAYFLNTDGEIIGKYDKIKLTPFGEHFPLGKYIPFLQKILDKFTDSAGFTPGNEYTVFHHNPLSFSVVICWEGTYGYFIRKFIKNGADFIINISNDMWTKSRAGHYEHFTITKFRAIENRIWYARAGNDGVTAIINPYGIVVKELPIQKAGYLIGEVGPRARETFYTKHGDILPILSVIIMSIGLFSSIYLLVQTEKLQNKKGR